MLLLFLLLLLLLLLLLVVVGCCLLLVAFCLLLVGCCWLLLVVVGCFCWFVVVVPVVSFLVPAGLVTVQFLVLVFVAAARRAACILGRHGRRRELCAHRIPWLRLSRGSPTRSNLMPCGRKPASLLASSAENASASGRLVAFGRVGLAVPVDATAAVVVRDQTGVACRETVPAGSVDGRFCGGGPAPEAKELVAAICLSVLQDEKEVTAVLSQPWVETWQGWDELDARYFCPSVFP